MTLFFDHPNFKQIYFNGRWYSNSEVLAEIDRLAAYLHKGNTSHSPFVYLFAPNHIKTVIAYLAIIRAGFIVVLIDPEIKHLELNELMQDTSPGVLIRMNRVSDVFDYSKEMVFRSEAPLPAAPDDLKNVCTMIYTAADDGYAKAAMLTKENILANARAIIDCDNVTETSTCCALAPFYHMYGLQTGMLAPILTGGELVIVDSVNENITECVGIIKALEVTNIYSLPMVYYWMAKVPEIGSALKSVRSIVSGGYKLASKIYDSFLKKTVLHICEGYGLSEAAPICAWHRPGDEIRIKSVGRAFSCCAITIRDEQGREVPFNETGEVCVQGNNVMKGYYCNATATEHALRDGLLHTGDLGKMDGQGYLYLTGLKKHMFNVGGHNVYPAEVERLMKLQENVRGVTIIGQEAALGGHLLKAEVTLKEDTPGARKGFQNWCGQNLSDFKVSKNIYFV